MNIWEPWLFWNVLCSVNKMPLLKYLSDHADSQTESNSVKKRKEETGMCGVTAAQLHWCSLTQLQTNI